MIRYTYNMASKYNKNFFSILISSNFKFIKNSIIINKIFNNDIEGPTTIDIGKVVIKNK